MNDRPAPARASLLEVDGSYELVVTSIADGAVARYRLEGLAVAILAESSTRALGHHARAQEKRFRDLCNSERLSRRKFRVPETLKRRLAWFLWR